MRTAQQQLALLHEIVEIACFGLQGLTAREGKQLCGETFAPSCRRQGRFAQPGTALGVFGMPQNDIQGTDHHGEKVVEIVRYSSRQAPQGLQSLRMQQRGFGLGFLRQRGGDSLFGE